MPGGYSLFSQLNNTRDDWKVLVLVTRVWEVANVWTHVVKNIDFVLMDEEGTQIHGRVDAIHYDAFKDLLQEGATLELKNFIVEEKKKKTYCPVRHKYNIVLKSTTKMEKSREVVCFPRQHFEFIEFDDLSKRVGNDEYLTDIVGIFNQISEVTYVGKEKKDKKKRDLILDNKSGKAIRITFWENCFATIPEVLDVIGQRIILIVTSTTVRQYIDEIYLQATSGTKIYINMEIPEVASLMHNIIEPPVEWKPTKKRYLSTEEKSKVADVKFALGESTKGEYVCSCNISKVYEEHKWYYISCGKCKKKINENTSWCDRCNEQNDNPTPRFKLQLEVHDETGSVNVTVFDKEATILMNISVDDMIKWATKDSGDVLVSERLQSIVGARHIFLLKITDYNVDHPTAPLTVANITSGNDEDKEKRMKATSA